MHTKLPIKTRRALVKADSSSNTMIPDESSGYLIPIETFSSHSGLLAHIL